MEVARYVGGSTTRQQQTQMSEPQLARLREDVATQPEWHLAEAHISRDDGYRGGKLNRPGLDRLRDRAALAVFERVLMTAPDCLARDDVHHRRLIDELAQRGCPVEFVERPMRQDPHDQLRLQIRGPWPSMRAPSSLIGGGVATKPSGAAARCGPGACHRMAMAWIPSARAIPSVCASIRSTPR